MRLQSLTHVMRWRNINVQTKSNTISINCFTFSLSKIVLLMFLTAVLMENKNSFFFSCVVKSETKNLSAVQVLRDWKICVWSQEDRRWLHLCCVNEGEQDRKWEGEIASVYLSHLSLSSTSVFGVIWSSQPVSSRPGTPCCMCMHACVYVVCVFFFKCVVFMNEEDV